jgi:hypothetical protein
MGKYNDFQNDHGMVGVSGASAATKTSAGLDCKGMEQVSVILRTGTIEATGTLDVEVQHSDDDGVGDAYATLTGAVFAQKVATDDDLTFLGKIKTNTAGVKRYLRISAVAAVADADYGCVMLSQNLSGHLPLTANALPAPEFNLNNP